MSARFTDLDPEQAKREAVWAFMGGVVGASMVLLYQTWVAPIQAENRAQLGYVDLNRDGVHDGAGAIASVQAEREKANALERLLSARDSALSACMADRSILQAVQGVNLPQITVTKADR